MAAEFNVLPVAPLALWRARRRGDTAGAAGARVSATVFRVAPDEYVPLYDAFEHCTKANRRATDAIVVARNIGRKPGQLRRKARFRAEKLAEPLGHPARG